MGTFLLGVAASVSAAGLVAIVAVLWRSRSSSLRSQLTGWSASRRLAEAGLSNFYRSRADYARYRNSADLGGFLRLAERSVHMVSYWLAQGVEMEHLGAGLKDLILSRQHLTVTISVIDPDAPFIGLLADHLGLPDEQIVQRIRGSLTVLDGVRTALPSEERHRLRLLTSTALPVASFILLDVDEPGGRIQMDVKPFRLPRSQSVTFEFRGTDTYLYKTLRGSALQVLAAAVSYEPGPSTRDISGDDA